MKHIEIDINKLYTNTKLYRFMPRSIFDALEQSFMEGKATAHVLESEFIKMTTATNLYDGSKSN